MFKLEKAPFATFGADKSSDLFFTDHRPKSSINSCFGIIDDFSPSLWRGSLMTSSSS